ncbi:MAG TPA: hypothetical protein VFB62_20650 [Polyangiaceae bacterium]|nr:hypothetical protein [Polyangiaceae bacterium]
MLRWGMQLALLGSIGCQSGVIVSSEPLPEIDDPPNQPFAPRTLEVRLVDADTRAPLDGDSGRTGADGRVVLDFENGAFMNVLRRVPSTAWRRIFTTFVPENMSAIERHIDTHPAVDREGPRRVERSNLDPAAPMPRRSTPRRKRRTAPAAYSHTRCSKACPSPILLTITGVPADVHDIRLKASASTPAPHSLQRQRVHRRSRTGNDGLRVHGRSIDSIVAAPLS